MEIIERGGFYQLAEHESQQVRTVALDALDRAICGVLASQQFQEHAPGVESAKDFNHEVNEGAQDVESSVMKADNGDSSASTCVQQSIDKISLECTLLQPLSTLYNYERITDIRAGALKTLLHILEVSLIDRFPVSASCAYTLGYASFSIYSLLLLFVLTASYYDYIHITNFLVNILVHMR